MKKTNIIYWITTGLFAFGMLGSAIPDILAVHMATEGFKSMGYPVYLVPFLGVAKALGVIAILVPGFPRLKEWAYAGLVFDLVGATYSVNALGMPLVNSSAMIVLLVLGFVSYAYHHKRLARKEQLKVARMAA